MMKPALRNFLWMAVGAVLLLGFMLLVLHNHELPDRAAQLASKAQRVELVDRMRLALASASEAEKSAVMAITDEDSQTYAEQARAAAATVEQDRRALERLLEPGGTQNEKNELTRFSQAFAEFQRIDKDLLDLAVKNTNLKASSLAFGPAAAALKEMDAALARLPSDDVKVVRLADNARIAGWRLLALLPPHIAEQSDQKMDELEAAMTKEDNEVRQSLQALAAMPIFSGNPDLKIATSSYDRFSETKAQILKLSRENTNVRSLAISLNQKRNGMFRCQDALAALKNAIEQEPVADVPARVPASPR